MFVVMEYGAGGNLENFVLHQRRLDEDDAKQLFHQLVAGVSYLHSRSILHGDVKLANAVLDASCQGVKLIDFGSSKKVQGLQTSRCGECRSPIVQRKISTPIYHAPEIVNVTRCRKGYSLPVDIWSLGISLHMMLGR
ncbi:unnamed protein product [Sphacelaria rigidula]